MSSSRQQDYPNSLYPEVGSDYRSGYSNANNSNSGDYYSPRRNSSAHRSHGDHARSRDHRHRDRNERHHRDARSASSRRSPSYDRGRDDERRTNGGSSRGGHDGRSESKTIKQRTRGVWEKFIPHEYRPSKADPEARHHRLSKERECEGFDWTQGWVLALIGTAALFSVEKSLVRRQKKEYFD
ncbi:hypothetical protein V8C35DRAFT_280629 [Trichoderma chlorosporum]